MTRPASLAHLWRNVFLTAMALFLALPLIVVASVSLNEKRRLIFPPQNATFKWYGYFFDSPAWMNALENSLLVGFASAAVATSIALPIAYMLWRRNGAYAGYDYSSFICHCFIVLILLFVLLIYRR